MLGYLRPSPAFQGGGKHKDFACAVTLILGIVTGDLPAPCRNWFPCFANQLPGDFILAYQNTVFIVFSDVNIKYILHRGYKL
jgi:hypothetical protein